MILAKVSIGKPVSVKASISIGGQQVPCADVSILDQDNNTIASVPAGGNYQVIVVSAISGGNASTVYQNSIIAIP